MTRLRDLEDVVEDVAAYLADHAPLLTRFAELLDQ